MQGLGCPVGSVIVGSRTLIQRAIRLRKVLGGGMRQVRRSHLTSHLKSPPQVGVLAAAGLYALDHNVARLAEDHSHARAMAELINNTGEGRFVVRKVDSNLVIAWVSSLSVRSRPTHLLQVDPTLCGPDDVVAALEAGDTKVLGMTFTKTNFRLAFHLDISDQLAALARDKMAQVIRKYLGK